MENNNNSVTDIKSLTLPELTAYVESIGEKSFRAKQLYQWLHIKHVASYDEMTNIPKSLITKLTESCKLVTLECVTTLVSKEDGTRKYLFAMPDGNVIESVFMRYKHGNSVCISSQAGCRMGCRFCASTVGGLIRSLKPSEMLDQIYRISADTGERISNVVVMGMGEPLDNYGNLLRFIELLTDENGLNISQRNVTVSTCGIVPRMIELADKKLQITLALSLHASTQEKRLELMPVANRYPLDEVIDACRYYFDMTGRRVTFEYSLVAGVNDTPDDAKELADLINGRTYHDRSDYGRQDHDRPERNTDTRNRNAYGSGGISHNGMMCHVNLIPVNPIKERDYRKPDASKVTAFAERLKKYGINATVRRTLGSDINASCGQLRKSFIDTNT